MEDPTASVNVRMLVVSLIAYCLLPVLGGLFSGLFISIRRRMWGAYCLTGSIIIGYVTSVTAVNSTVHMEYGFVITTFGAILPCLVTLLFLSAIWVIGRAFGAVRWFGRSLTSDVATVIHRLHELRRSKDTSIGGSGPQDTVKLPWRWVVRIILSAVVLLIGRNAKEILDFLHNSAPRMSVVTNSMDLVALIFSTPKLFSGEARDNLHHLFAETANAAFGKVVVAWDTKRVLLAGAALFIIIFPMLYILSEVSLNLGPQLLETMDALSAALRSKGVNGVSVDLIDWIRVTFSGWLLIFDRFSTFINESALVIDDNGGLYCLRCKIPETYSSAARAMGKFSTCLRRSYICLLQGALDAVGVVVQFPIVCLQAGT